LILSDVMTISARWLMRAATNPFQRPFCEHTVKSTCSSERVLRHGSHQTFLMWSEKLLEFNNINSMLTICICCNIQQQCNLSTNYFYALHMIMKINSEHFLQLSEKLISNL
jgi:hypothetical protein